jgi:WD40 repeat protein
VRAAAFSGDGALLVSGGDDAKLIVWDAVTGRELRRFDQQPDSVCAVAFAPTGRMLASQGRDRAIRLWDASTGELQSTLPESGESGIYFLRFSPNGKLLATRQQEGRLNVWDVETGQRRHQLHMWLGPQAADFSPDGRLLAGLEWNQVVIWDVHSGRKIATSSASSGFLRCMAFSPDGNALAIGFGDGTLVHYHMLSGRSRRFAHGGYIVSVAFSPDGSMLASGGQDGSIKLWTAAWLPEASPAPVGPGGVWAVAFSPDGKSLAADEAGGVRLRDAVTGDILAEFPTPVGVLSLAFSPQGELLVSCDDDGAVRLWDVRQRQPLGILQQDSKSMYAAKFSPDGRILATGGGAGAITLWDVESRKVVVKIQSEGSVWSLDFSRDGSLLASGGTDGHGVRLWDWQEHKALKDIPQAFGPVAFSRDGTMLMCQDHSGLKLWNLRTTQIRTIGENQGNFFCSHSRLALFPDGRTLALAENGRATLWDISTGRELPMIRTYPHWVFSVAVSPDGQTLATGGDDGTVQIWRTNAADGALAAVPPLPPTPGGAALQLSLRDSPEIAVRLYSNALKLDPTWQKGYEQRAAVYVELGRIDEAAADFAKALELSPDDRWDYMSPLFARLLECDERVFECLASAQAELWLERGRYFALRGEWERAVADYARVIKSPEPNEEYAALLVLTSDDEAHQHLCRELESCFAQIDQPGLARRLAMICSQSPQSGIVPSQIVHWAELAMRSERNKFTLKALALARYRNGEFGEAARLLQEAMELPQPMPRSAAAFPLALAYRELGEQEESRKWYQLGISELPSVTPQMPARWALSHWLGVNVWYREAKAVFEPTGPNGAPSETPPAAKAPELTKPEAFSKEYQDPPSPVGRALGSIGTRSPFWPAK